MTKDCPVEILQYAWEFDVVLDLYKRAKPKTVLEIGSLYGGTLYHWLNIGEPDVSILSIDLFATIDYFETQTLWASWVKYEQSLTAVKQNSLSIESIQLAQDKFKEGIDWLFIDGDHSKEGVKSDYNNYFPLVSENGYCIFHDIFGENGVSEFWNELKEKLDGRFPIIEICHSRYNLGIGIIQKWQRDESNIVNC